MGRRKQPSALPRFTYLERSTLSKVQHFGPFLRKGQPRLGEIGNPCGADPCRTSEAEGSDHMTLANIDETSTICQEYGRNSGEERITRSSTSSLICLSFSSTKRLRCIAGKDSGKWKSNLVYCAKHPLFSYCCSQALLEICIKILLDDDLLPLDMEGIFRLGK